MALALSALKQKLFSIDKQPHEHQDFLVGISCFWLITPALPAYQNDDKLTAMLTVFVTICSFFADCLFVGTVWNVIDRWVAFAYTFYLYSLVFTQLPLLSTLNLVPLLAFLSYSRSSKTKAQWRFRHSLWHFFLAIDMPLFLTFGAYRS
eukprot:TRINITY_DN110772_c0_g1_i1.p1 TRINITY_DN110772_c0_g1~~TRINITY_DN110772_c0_g1_i1.p1  ORF type:complete len:149 (+),score=22.00 TRINITY_DN110772_c0_g1_i1:78-524(+)